MTAPSEHRPSLFCLACRLCAQAATEKPRDGYYMELAPWPQVTVMTVFHPEGTKDLSKFISRRIGIDPDPAALDEGSVPNTLPVSGGTCVSSAWHWDIYSGIEASCLCHSLAVSWLGCHLQGAGAGHVLSAHSWRAPGLCPSLQLVPGLPVTAPACNHRQHQELVYTHLIMRRNNHSCSRQKFQNKCPLT